MTPRLLAHAAVAAAGLALAPAPAHACQPEYCPPPPPYCSIKAVYNLGICPPWTPPPAA